MNQAPPKTTKATRFRIAMPGQGVRLSDCPGPWRVPAPDAEAFRSRNVTQRVDKSSATESWQTLDEVQTARRRTERNEIDGEAPDGREGRGGDDRFALNFGGRSATIAIGEQLEPLISPLEASDRRSPFVSRLIDDAKEELREAKPRNEDENEDEPETGSTEVNDQEDSKRTEDEVDDWIIQDEPEKRLVTLKPVVEGLQLTPEWRTKTETPKIEELIVKPEIIQRVINPVIEELRILPERRLTTLTPVVEDVQVTPDVRKKMITPVIEEGGGQS